MFISLIGRYNPYNDLFPGYNPVARLPPAPALAPPSPAAAERAGAQDTEGHQPPAPGPEGGRRYA